MQGHSDDLPRIPGSIGNAVQRLIRSRGLLERSATDLLNDAWKQAVGPELARHSRAIKIREGTLEVAVTNSAALHEIHSYHQESILKQLQAKLPDSGIRALRCRRARA
ncbi:MAG UNVERIFIED_CONTAM: DUF721 domain-containing protein [Planctomycetaceae bacterium]